MTKENRDKLFKPELNFLYFEQDKFLPIDEMSLPLLFREEDRIPDYPKASYALGWEIHPDVPKAGMIHEHGAASQVLTPIF